MLQACSSSDNELKDNKIRYSAIKDAAISYGAQSALAWQSKKINSKLASKKQTLNEIYDFQRIMLPHNVLPPVIREATNSLNLDDSKTLRAADRTIEIVSDAKFVTTPPSWRDYLIMTYEAPDKPAESMLPKTGDERAIWDQNVTIGWNIGYKQATAILRENLGKLAQDYSGMAFYKKLYAQGMVTAPQVAMATLGITGNNRKVTVNDRIVRITSDSQLSSSNYWKPVISIKKVKSTGIPKDGLK